MKVEFKVEPNNGFVKIFPSGSVGNVAEYIQLQIEYFRIISVHEVNKGYIDVADLKFPEGVIDQIEVLKFDLSNDEFQGIHSIKVAIKGRPDLEDIGRFFEDYAINRGLNFRVFKTENEAIEWLLN